VSLGSPRVLGSVRLGALAMAAKRRGLTTHDVVPSFGHSQSFAEALHHLLRRLARARASRWATTCGCRGTSSTASARSTMWRPPSTPSPSPATGTARRCHDQCARAQCHRFDPPLLSEMSQACAADCSHVVWPRSASKLVHYAEKNWRVTGLTAANAYQLLTCSGRCGRPHQLQLQVDARRQHRLGRHPGVLRSGTLAILRIPLRPCCLRAARHPRSSRLAGARQTCCPTGTRCLRFARDMHASTRDSLIEFHKFFTVFKPPQEWSYCTHIHSMIYYSCNL